jgi:molybdopterin-synthase adenylyltransferase|tara:strand:+ start:870 stop:1625 length:756 start_codon:yes stop_codon:yes gene_type:complete
MNDADLLRYSRHILLPEVDLEGQEKLLKAKVAIIGLGGLGSPVALYLAASGIGEITLVDDDRVDLGNLQRQIVHAEADLGQNKVDSAARALSQINSTLKITPLAQRLTGDALDDLVDGVDAVVDCTDNFETRLEINRACVQGQKPLISGAAIRLEGQLLTVDPNVPNGPCYQCLYGKDAAVQQDCATTGVIAPIVGVIGSLLALETLRVLLGIAQDHTGQLTTFDGRTNRWHQFKFKKRVDCPICATPSAP